jgi:CO/xanthine dehydrogenase Mo-binding subunit
MGKEIVRGGKIFARDFRAHDIKNLPQYGCEDWGDITLRAMFVRAQRLGYIIEGINVDKVLKLGARKCFIKRAIPGFPDYSLEDILGSNEKITFSDPQNDFLVTLGNAASYVGQPVCLLIFDDIVRFLDAQREKESLVSIFQQKKYATSGPTGFESISLLEDSARIFDQTVWPPQNTPEDKWSERIFSDGDGKILYKGNYEKDIMELLKQNQDRVLNLVTVTPAVDVAYLEPDSSLGRVMQRDDGSKLVKLIVPSQSHYTDYASLTIYNKIVGYDFEFLPCFLGGGFGGRSSSPFTVYAALATIAGNGIPVRLEYDRIEQFVSGIKRHPSRVETNILFKNTGDIEAIETRLLIDGGSMVNLSVPVLGLSTHSSSGAYRSEKRAYRGFPLKNTGVLSGSMRGFGIPQALFNIEQQIDRIAAILGKDPLSYREQIALQTGDKDIDEKLLRHPLKNKAVLSAASNTTHWRNRQDRKSEFSSLPTNTGHKFGTGVAFVMEAFGASTDRPAAALRLTKDYLIEVDCFPVQMGQGTVESIESYVSNIFSGVEVKVNSGRGAFLSKILGKGKDKPLTVDPNAAAKGAFGTMHVLENLIEIWLHYVWAPQLVKQWNLHDEFDVKKIQFLNDGTIRYEDQLPLVFATVAKTIAESNRASIYGAAIFRNTWAYSEFEIEAGLALEPRWLSQLSFGNSKPDINSITPVIAKNIIDPTTNKDSPSRSLYSCAACLVDVVVDYHGNIELKKITVVLDSGHRLSDQRVRQQIEGGIVQGIGHTLLESYPSGPLGGQQDINFDRYALPRIRHIPSEGIETIFLDLDENEPVYVEIPNANGTQPKIKLPLRLYKGISEVSISPIAPAIANAIIDAIFDDASKATDCRFTRWPITAADVKERMEMVK